MTETPLLSVVVPVYNEDAIIASFCEHLSTVLRECVPEYEVLLVDDGSTDASVATLRRLSAGDPRLRYLSLSRNFGHQVAVKAGLHHAVGRVVVTMDGDGQHLAEIIPRMLELWEDRLHRPERELP